MKKNTIIFIILFFIGLVLNFQNLKPAEDVGNDWKKLDSSCYKEKTLIIEHGDIDAYKKLLKHYKLYKNGKFDASSCFYYAFIMATKYEYFPANYDVYLSLIKPYGTVNSLDKNTKRLAVFFLYRGMNRGDKRCKKIFESIQRNLNK